MRAVQKLGVVLCAGLLSACADTGGIHSTLVPKPLSQLSLSHGLVNLSQADSPKPQADWWRMLGDAQLDGLMDEVLAHSPTVALAAAHVREAMGLGEVAGASLKPRVDFKGKVSGMHWADNALAPPTLGGADTWFNFTNLSVSYALDIWGQNRARALAATDLARARVESQRAAVLLLSSQMVQAYVFYAHDTTQLRVLTQWQASADKAVAIEQIRLAHGLTDADQVALAALSAAQVAEQITVLNGDLQLRVEQIAILTGRGVRTRIPLRPPSLLGESQPKFNWQVPHHVLINLIGARPDVQARRWEVESATQNIKVARTAFYPNINLAANLGSFTASGGFLSFLKSNSAFYSAGPSVSLPIFEGGRLRGQLRAQTARYDAAVAQYDQTLLTALSQVAEALTQLQTLQARQAVLTLAVRAADQEYAIAQRRYAAGLSNRLPVLAAQNRQCALQLKQDEIDSQVLANFAGLFAALGGTVLPEARPVPPMAGSLYE